MGINSTEVSYGFGQMGSIHIAGTALVTSNLVTTAADKTRVGEEAVFCAITFLEDTAFANTLAGLTPASANLYVGGTGSTSSSISTNGAITGTEVFPKGVTIYGRWTSITLATGRIIAYVGY
tara:strand:- start:278 stop:643 length:366 start_codon:yes stop_codon:yes gene_type:complete